jgi:uncharacterized membrane protein YdjX (TVP38/TMEM64 family)
LKKLITAAVVLTAAAALHFSGAADWLTLENIQTNRDRLYDYVQFHYLTSAAVFVASYIIVAGFALPGAAVMTLMGGFLFGMPYGWLFSVTGATGGAVVAFLLSRYLLGSLIQRKYPQKLARFNGEMKKNGSMYLLTLRFIPLFPFFLINVFAGLTSVSFMTFLWTTLAGIAPGGLVFAYAGRRLGSLSSVSDIFSGEMLLAFCLLGALALAPVAYRKLRPA